MYPFENWAELYNLLLSHIHTGLWGEGQQSEVDPMCPLLRNYDLK